MQREMAIINDCVIVDALEAMANVMVQENEDLQVNHNQNVGVDGFCGLGKFQRNNLPTFKWIYDPEGAQSWLQEIEKIFRVMGCKNEQKVLFGTHMMSEKAEY